MTISLVQTHQRTLARDSPATQTLAGVARLRRVAALKRPGALLLAHSILFGLLVILLA